MCQGKSCRASLSRAIDTKFQIKCTKMVVAPNAWTTETSKTTSKNIIQIYSAQIVQNRPAAIKETNAIVSFKKKGRVIMIKTCSTRTSKKCNPVGWVLDGNRLLCRRVPSSSPRGGHSVAFTTRKVNFDIQFSHYGWRNVKIEFVQM